MGSNRVEARQAVATNLKVDASGVAVPITDNGGSLTVDGAVTVSGTATVSGTVTATGPLTDTQLRATAVPVSGTVTANAGTNLNTSALALDATQATTNTEIGIVTETAPASDTASSGLNGRLQRIAQRLTSLIAVFTIGAGTEAAAVRVTLPTDGTGKVNAAQSGTWTVQPGNTANTTAWKVDGSAVTQPVSLAANQSVNVAQINGVTPLMGNGASGTGAQRVTLANDSTGVIATVAAVTAITNALPAGANAIGKLAANSGVDIGDVDVTTVGTVTPGTAATALGKAVDGVAGSTDTGVLTLAVRDDVLTTLTPVDGDYTQLRVTSTGALHANLATALSSAIDSVTVATGVTAADLGKAEDAAHTSGDVGVMALAVRNDAVGSLSGTTGDYTPLTTTSLGGLRIAHIDPAQAIHKAVNVTTTQTGSDVWSPASGKKIAVTSLIISAYATTAGRVILWFGDNADTTYTAGTDQVLAAASFAPSATVKSGMVYTPATPVFCTTADRELHLTTDAGISLDITVEGYEF